MGVLEMESWMQHSTEKREAGDLLVSYLASLGVEFTFGIPGGAIEPMFDALARSQRQGGPRMVVARHETGSAFMAAGYAKNSGRLGVCCSTTGPGATNLITGVASAYNDNIPLLVITAQTAIQNFGGAAFQESSDTGTNLIGMFEYCTIYNSLVSHIDQFERKLVNAILLALNEQKPVHLSVPINIFREKIACTPLYDLVQQTENINDTATVNQSLIKKLGGMLADSRQPVFVLSKGCEDSIDVIENCAFATGAHIVTTPDGKGLLHPHHPLYKGVVGFAGHQLARDVLQSPEVDTILVVGSTMGEWSTAGWREQDVMNHRLVHIHPRTEHLCRAPMAKMHIRGSIRQVFESLHQYLQRAGTKKPLSFENGIISKHALPVYQDQPPQLEEGWQKNRVSPQWLMLKLPHSLPSSTRYIADVGNSMAWAIHYLHPYEKRQVNRIKRRNGSLFQATIEYASMGWAIGVSVGAALANREQPVVCITGDGSWLMSGQEITVAQQENLPIIFIVLNDGALGMVKHGQRMTGAEQTGYKLPCVDFAMQARSVGVQGLTIHCAQDWLDLCGERDWSTGGPLLLDVRIDQEQVPPIQARTNTLKQQVK